LPFFYLSQRTLLLAAASPVDSRTMAALGDAAHASATANSMQAAASSGGAITAPFDALSLLCPQGQLCTGGSLRELVSKYQGVEVGVHQGEFDRRRHSSVAASSMPNASPLCTCLQGLVALNPGLPPDDCFPVKGMQLDVEGVEAPVHLTPEALVTAQQLGLSCAGHPPLVRWVAAHVEALHAPPGPHDVLITTGSSNGLDVRAVCSAFGLCCVVLFGRREAPCSAGAFELRCDV
jgi:hypothetical protein